MSAVDDSMRGVSMKCCNAVTAVQNGTGPMHLLRIKRGVYLSSLIDSEVVVNTHFISEAGWHVDEVTNYHGGSQSVWFPNGDELPLEYDAIKYKMFLQSWKPSPLEIKTIPIQ
eukprot:2511094-Ditylum_brightwellii.AAC.1